MPIFVRKKRFFHVLFFSYITRAIRYVRDNIDRASCRLYRVLPYYFPLPSLSFSLSHRDSLSNNLLAATKHHSSLTPGSRKINPRNLPVSSISAKFRARVRKPGRSTRSSDRVVFPTRESLSAAESISGLDLPSIYLSRNFQTSRERPCKMRETHAQTCTTRAGYRGRIRVDVSMITVIDNSNEMIETTI